MEDYTMYEQEIQKWKAMYAEKVAELESATTYMDKQINTIEELRDEKEKLDFLYQQQLEANKQLHEQIETLQKDIADASCVDLQKDGMIAQLRGQIDEVDDEYLELKRRYDDLLDSIREESYEKLKDGIHRELCEANPNAIKEFILDIYERAFYGCKTKKDGENDGRCSREDD